jgi:hypothetical protein
LDKDKHVKIQRGKKANKIKMERKMREGQVQKARQIKRRENQISYNQFLHDQ